MKIKTSYSRSIALGSALNVPDPASHSDDWRPCCPVQKIKTPLLPVGHGPTSDLLGAIVKVSA